MKKTAILFTVAVIMLLSKTILANKKNDLVFISGKIDDYSKYKDSAEIVKFEFDDIVLGERLMYSAHVLSDGSFSVKFKKVQAQEIIFIYNKSVYNIIVKPGGHLFIKFNPINIDSSVSFSGNLARLNSNLKSYTNSFQKKCIFLYGDDMSRYTSLAHHQKVDGPFEYKIFVEKRYAFENKLINELLKDHAYKNDFIKLIKTENIFEFAHNLISYPYTHAHFNRLNYDDSQLPPSTYFSFVDRLPVLNSLDILPFYYEHYINTFLVGYFFKKTLKREHYIDEEFAALSRLPSNYNKDVLICRWMNRYLKPENSEYIKKHIPQFKVAVKNKTFKDEILQRYRAILYQQNHYKLSASEKINTLSANDDSGLLKEISNKFPNKILYLDFWATWCGPCLEEMKYSKLLPEKLKNQNVVFLYLCLQSKESVWKSTIARLDIGGEHYLLTQKQYDAMAVRFKVTGIPHYVLIDKQGNIVDRDARRPSDPSLIEQIKNLDGQ